MSPTKSGSAYVTGQRSLVYRQDGVYAENAGAIFCQILPPLPNLFKLEFVVVKVTSGYEPDKIGLSLYIRAKLVGPNPAPATNFS